MKCTLTFHRQSDISDLAAVLIIGWTTRQNPFVILPCHIEFQFGYLSAIFLFSLYDHIS